MLTRIIIVSIRCMDRPEGRNPYAEAPIGRAGGLVDRRDGWAQAGRKPSWPRHSPRTLRSNGRLPAVFSGHRPTVLGLVFQQNRLGGAEFARSAAVDPSGTAREPPLRGKALGHFVTLT